MIWLIALTIIGTALFAWFNSHGWRDALTAFTGIMGIIAACGVMLWFGGYFG